MVFLFHNISSSSSRQCCIWIYLCLDCILITHIFAHIIPTFIIKQLLILRSYFLCVRLWTTQWGHTSVAKCAVWW